MYRHEPTQEAFRTITDLPLSYWLANDLFMKFAEGKKLASQFLIKGGLSTTDNSRFVRFHWETSSSERWFNYTKGGGIVDGQETIIIQLIGTSGSRMKAYIVTIPGNTHWSRRIFNSKYSF